MSIMGMTLEHITGRESGTIEYPDGSLMVGSWSGIAGIPRIFGSGGTAGLVGFSEILEGEKIKPPSKKAIVEMQRRSKENNDRIWFGGYKSWKVWNYHNKNDSVIVTINVNWN